MGKKTTDEEKIERIFKKKKKPSIKKIQTLAEKGFTDKEMAEFFGLTCGEWYRWKRHDVAFKDNLLEWKKVADNNVRESLYKKATGFTITEQKAFQDKKTGQVTVVDIQKEIPPDTQSMIFWLKNRRPDEFRDTVRQEHDVTGTLAEALKEARERRQLPKPEEEKKKIKDVTPNKKISRSGKPKVLSGEEDFLK